MTGQQFKDWLKAMKDAGRAKSEAECGALLGVTANPITRMKREGTDIRTDLACAALLAGLRPHP